MYHEKQNEVTSWTWENLNFTKLEYRKYTTAQWRTNGWTKHWQLLCMTLHETNCIVYLWDFYKFRLRQSYTYSYNGYDTVHPRHHRCSRRSRYRWFNFSSRSHNQVTTNNTVTRETRSESRERGKVVRPNLKERRSSSSSNHLTESDESEREGERGRRIIVILEDWECASRRDARIAIDDVRSMIDESGSTYVQFRRF